MEYKLIALDLDGTLKDSNNQITPKTREALIQVQKQGVKIVLASGRPTAGLRHEAKELMLDQFGGYLLSFNGARVASAKTNETIYEQTLTVEDAQKTYQRAKQFDLACMTYKNDMIYTEDIDDEYVCSSRVMTRLVLTRIYVQNTMEIMALKELRLELEKSDG